MPKGVGGRLQERIFNPFGMRTTGMTWQNRGLLHLARSQDEGEKESTP